jgi:hypothetical protein
LEDLEKNLKEQNIEVVYCCKTDKKLKEEKYKTLNKMKKKVNKKG